jgi:hypothetical protein
MLVNYFARELSRWWRYDELEIGHNEQVVLLSGVRPRAVRKQAL